MNEFTRSLLYVALLICIPIVTACIQKGIAVFIEFIAAKTNDIKVQRLVREIGSAVSNAVAAMNQTYVNDLKTAGTFKEAEQKEALMEYDKTLTGEEYAESGLSQRKFSVK